MRLAFAFTCLLAFGCSSSDEPTKAPTASMAADSASTGTGAGGTGTTATSGAGAAGGDGGGSDAIGGAGGEGWSEPPLPDGCPKNARIFTYDPVGHGHLADAVGANPSPCADYYIHLPAIASDKTNPRGPAAVDDVHSHGARFHALAEFHWGAWSAVTGMTWLEKGKEFRKRM